MFALSTAGVPNGQSAEVPLLEDSAIAQKLLPLAYMQPADVVLQSKPEELLALMWFADRLGMPMIVGVLANALEKA